MTPRQRQLVINDTVDLNRAAFSLRQHADEIHRSCTNAAGKFDRREDRDLHRELLRLAAVVRRVSTRETRRANAHD